MSTRDHTVNHPSYTLHSMDVLHGGSSRSTDRQAVRRYYTSRVYLRPYLAANGSARLMIAATIDEDPITKNDSFQSPVTSRRNPGVK